MAVLTFSAPFLSLTQKNSVQAEVIAAGEHDAETNINKNNWLFGGCLGSWIALLLAYVREPAPPASRLLGKSPEYIAFYTDAYKAKAKNIQTDKAWTGCIVGTLVGAASYGCFVIAVGASASEP